jgi:UDP-N-acetylmuramate--alanine ligase
VQRARNYLTDEFVRSEMDYMLFIDSDIHFEAQDIFVMMHHAITRDDMDVICGPYPKKAISWEKIKSAVASFAGVKRRFEYIVRTPSLVYIDDYAHHPEELRALITGAKDMYPSKKCTIIFQPHLFTRTRDLVDGFAASLDLADEIILLPIYPARELPIEGVSSEMIMERMKGKVVLKNKNELEALILEMQPELLLTAGAGDIDTMIEPLKNAMFNR